MSSEFKHERQRMRSDVRAQGRRSRERRKKVTEGIQTNLIPLKCPKCGSYRVVTRVKDTFQYDGFNCLDCNEHFY